MPVANFTVPYRRRSIPPEEDRCDFVINTDWCIGEWISGLYFIAPDYMMQGAEWTYLKELKD